MINLFLIVSIVIVAIYCVLIIAFSFLFANYKIKKNYETSIKPIDFSIIIAARNEEKNIENCLNSINKAILNSNGNHELIVVDDNSTDSTLVKLNQFKNSTSKLTVVELEKLNLSTKKEALKAAAKIAKNKWLIFTDADCVVDVDWLVSFQNQIANSSAKLVAGPVSVLSENNFLNAFQLLDMFSMTGSACASIAMQKPMLCNGANLAVEKQVFDKATEDPTYSKKASGDDVFLLFYVAKNYGVVFISYLKSNAAKVETVAQQNWRDLWLQRKRWVSKSTAYSRPFMALISLLVYFSSVSLLFLACVSVVSPEKKIYFFLAFIAKSVIDFIFLFLVADFFRKVNTLIWFIPVQIVHVLYICIVPLLSINSKYVWKGRKLK